MAQASENLEQITAASQFQRGCVKSAAFTIPTDPANARVFKFDGFSGGRLFVDNLGGGTITWYETYDPAVAVSKAHKASDGTAITSTIGEAGGFEIPSTLFGCAYIAPVINSGTVAGLIVFKK